MCVDVFFRVVVCVFALCMSVCVTVSNAERGPWVLLSRHPGHRGFIRRSATNYLLSLPHNTPCKNNCGLLPVITLPASDAWDSRGPGAEPRRLPAWLTKHATDKLGSV